MNLESFVLSIFIIGVVLGLGFTAFTLIGAPIYDFLSLRRERRLRRKPYNKVYRYRPLLSIIIPVHNEELLIERTLDSLLKSSIRKFEIIVADDASTDNTPKIVRRYIKEHPKRAIYLARRRTNGGRGAAIDEGLKRANGEIIMALDADCTVDKYALRNMVRHFADGETAAVAANIRIAYTGDTLSLLQQFDYLVSFRSKKFNTLANSEYIIGGAGATYRREVVDALNGFDHSMKTEDIEMSLRIANDLGNREAKLKYASDVLVYTEPVPSYRSLFKQRYRWKFGSLQALYKHRKLLLSLKRQHSWFLSFVRLPFVLWSEILLVFEPLFFSYFLYLALINRNATLFASASIFIAGLLLITIWSDEYLKARTKLRLSLYSPMMYLVFYILTIIQIVAAARSLINIKSLIGKKKVSGAYVPTDRVRKKSMGPRL